VNAHKEKLDMIQQEENDIVARGIAHLRHIELVRATPKHEWVVGTDGYATRVHKRAKKPKNALRNATPVSSANG